MKFTRISKKKIALIPCSINFRDLNKEDILSFWLTVFRKLSSVIYKVTLKQQFFLAWQCIFRTFNAMLNSIPFSPEKLSFQSLSRAQFSVIWRECFWNYQFTLPWYNARSPSSRLFVCLLVCFCFVLFCFLKIYPLFRVQFPLLLIVDYFFFPITVLHLSTKPFLSAWAGFFIFEVLPKGKNIMCFKGRALFQNYVWWCRQKSSTTTVKI